MNNFTTRKPLLSVLISQILAVPASASVFDLNCGDTTGLIDAMASAGNHEINLNVDNQANCVYPLNNVNNNTDGANGLPSVTSSITINGNQSAIQRQNGSPEFRIIHVASSGNLTLTQVSVEKGSATGSWLHGYGGGIFNRGELILEESTVSGNTADRDGGGISNFWYSTTTLTNSTVSGNTADGGGGGIYNSWYSTTTLTNSTVSENTANRNGGGIFNYYESTTTLTNSTISGNTASDDGGGIFNLYSTTTLTNSTVSGNTAEVGGGIHNYYSSTATLKNTILAGNTATLHPDCFNYNIINANHYNLFGGNGTECNAGVTDLKLGGMTIDDVLNTTLADNGGPTLTHALVDDSPAIDAVAEDVCPDIGIETDQRGVSRPQGTACDIGAFEYQPPDLAQLSHFQAVATPTGIRLQWQTTKVSDHAGFRIFRATRDHSGDYTNITLLDYPQAQTLTATPLAAVTNWNRLITAALASSESCYSYLDANAAVVGTTYFYLLEDVDMGGHSTRHWEQLASATVGQKSEANPLCEED
jgi:parallel beta-helix repeat protein